MASKIQGTHPVYEKLIEAWFELHDVNECAELKSPDKFIISKV